MKESQKCGSLHLPIPSAAPRAAPFTKQISHAAGSTRTSPEKPALKSEQRRGRKNSKKGRKDQIPAASPPPALLPAGAKAPKGAGLAGGMPVPGWDVRVPSCHHCFGVPEGPGGPQDPEVGWGGMRPPASAGAPRTTIFLGGIRPGLGRILQCPRHRGGTGHRVHVSRHAQHRR